MPLQTPRAGRRGDPDTTPWLGPQSCTCIRKNTATTFSLQRQSAWVWVCVRRCREGGSAGFGDVGCHGGVTLVAGTGRCKSKPPAKMLTCAPLSLPLLHVGTGAQGDGMFVGFLSLQCSCIRPGLHPCPHSLPPTSCSEDDPKIEMMKEAAGPEGDQGKESVSEKIKEVRACGRVPAPRSSPVLRPTTGKPGRSDSGATSLAERATKRAPARHLQGITHAAQKVEGAIPGTKEHEARA